MLIRLKMIFLISRLIFNPV